MPLSPRDYQLHGMDIMYSLQNSQVADVSSAYIHIRIDLVRPGWAWPIGVVLDCRDDSRGGLMPRPRQPGINAAAYETSLELGAQVAGVVLATVHRINGVTSSTGHVSHMGVYDSATRRKYGKDSNFRLSLRTTDGGSLRPILTCLLDLERGTVPTQIESSDEFTPQLTSQVLSELGRMSSQIERIAPIGALLGS